MLPPVELNSCCPRCSRELAPEVRFCPDCGADRELELAIRGQLDPAIASLQRWLGLLAAVAAVSALMVYVEIHDLATAHELALLCGPGLVLALMLVLLSATARLMPLGVSLIALGLFAVHIGLSVQATGWGALAPDIVLGFRLMFLVVLGGAVQAGWRARVLRRRAQRDFPTAIARMRRE